MPASNVIKNFCDGQVTLIDGSAAYSLAVRFENGDFSASGHEEKMRAVNAYQGRGRFYSLRHTERTFPSGSFSVQLSELAGSNALPDALGNRGTWSAATSTLGNDADVYTLDLQFKIEGSEFGDTSDHTTVYEDCYFTFDYAEGDPNTITVNWTCYGDITGDLAQTAP